MLWWNSHQLLFSALFIALAISSCSNNQEEIDLSNIKINLSFQPLEDRFFEAQTREDILDFLVSNEEVSRAFFGYEEDNAELVEQLYDMRHNPAIGELYQEVKLHFGSYEALQKELTQAFQRIKYYYPDFKAPRVYTMITGMGSDLYVDEEFIVIGTDFFMGEYARFRPLDLPNYILNRYTESFILPAIVLLISDQFNLIDGADQSMLAEMIASGKSYYFTQNILPGTSEQELIAYTEENMRDIVENEAIIWSHFIERALLYETSHFVKNKYMGERPFVAEIGRRCPGRIGAWLGWRMVQQYMRQNPQIDLPGLMATKNAQEIFQASKYKPRG